MSDASPSDEGAVNSKDAKQARDDQQFSYVPLTLADLSIVTRTNSEGNVVAVDMPADVSLAENVAVGQQIGYSGTTLNDKLEGIYDLFRSGGTMDYQLNHSSSTTYNFRFIDFGNFNYGVVAAAAGIPLDTALIASGIYNLRGSGSKGGIYFNNPRNERMIRAGYAAYSSGNIPGMIEKIARLCRL